MDLNGPSLVGMREAAQMVSYEIPLAICGLVPIVALGTLNLDEVSAIQRGWVTNWMIFHDPFTFITFFVYFTVATAGCKRAPFDLAEAESELVGGFHTEYSGMRWSFFFMAEYAAMFLVSGVAAILFLGGWNSGIGVVDTFIDEQLRTWWPNFIVEGIYSWKLHRQPVWFENHACQSIVTGICSNLGSMDSSSTAN